GEEIKATHEEVEAVQVFSEILVTDYRYTKEQIQTRPQWRVKRRPSDTNKTYPIDIAVFDGNKSDDNLFIVVECKRKSRKDGLSQLKDYLRLSNAQLGVWFNGDERLFIRKYEKAGQVLFSEIPNIPRKGERLEDLGRFKRRDLVVPHNLKVIFRTIRNHLAGNTVGATRDEILAQQLINVIFCKIYDERFTKQDAMVEFRAGLNESAQDIAARVKRIFETVKAQYKEVIDFNEAISLDDRSTAYIVGELQNYCLMESERDVIADAFETFIGYALKGEQGQFFTPRNVIRLMVEIIQPQSDHLIVDPACGSGGFLVEGLKYIWDDLETRAKGYGWTPRILYEEKMKVAVQHIRGVEKDEFLSKVAKAYMALIGDGQGGIFCEDSLDVPQNWKSSTRQRIVLGTFDVLLTNPPFGKAIAVEGRDKLVQYDLASKWQKQGDRYEKMGKTNPKMRPETLFIERSLQLLKDGGVMGIVLPETFFHAPQARYVMQFMEQHNIQWIIDLPHNTFRPHNNAKCLIVVLQKNRPQGKTINFAVAEEMGHDHQGKAMYRWDPRTQEVDRGQLWDDIQIILEENRTGRRKDIFSVDTDQVTESNIFVPRYIFSVDTDQVKENNIFVPRYYWETRDQEVEDVAANRQLRLVSIKQLID
ncbi:MAG: N-6 DNA methylase, partial [Nitrospira sp.]|nr:N-6 DNA methylase [Nitrospira sp.]